MTTLRHKINWERCYPEARRARWDAEDDRRRDRFEERIAALEAEVERLKHRAA